MNPIHQKLLEKLPPALHSLVQPILDEWDADVTKKFQDIHAEYEPLKAFQPFVDNNITADFAYQSVVFADELQREPAKIAQQISDNWDLGLVTKADLDKAVAEAAKPAGDDPLFDADDETKVDLTKVPEFVTMKQTLDALQQSEEEKRRNSEQAQALADFEQELADLEKATTDAGKPFNKMFVTALMAQGLSGEDAVTQYQQVLAGTVTPPTDEPPAGTDAPVTMGNGGTVGSGQGDGTVKWADMTTSDFNANVAKVLEASMQAD